MKKYLILLSLLFTVPAIASLEPYIVQSVLEDDNNREKHLQELLDSNLIKEKCSEFKKKSFRHTKCKVSTASSMSREKYPWRGTDAYCEKHYKPLSKKAAMAKLQELKDLFDSGKLAFTSRGQRKPGELIRGNVKLEISWLEQHLELDRASELRRNTKKLHELWK